MAALEKAFHAGGDGYSEEAIRALRLYQLGAPDGAHALLNSMPRGIGDLMSFLWMTTAPVGDIPLFFNTVYPKDELVMDGCSWARVGGNIRLFRTYFVDAAKASVANPKYLPGFVAASQLFGYKADWEENFEGRGCTPVRLVPMFTQLLAFQLRARPKEFLRFARWTRFGGSASKQAKAALAAEKRKAEPAKPDKGSHGAR